MCVLPSVLLCGLAPVLTTYWLNVWREKLRFRVTVWIKTSGERWEKKRKRKWVWSVSVWDQQLFCLQLWGDDALHAHLFSDSIEVCVWFYLPVTGMTYQQQRRWHTYTHKPVRTDSSRSRHCSSFRVSAQNSFIKRSSSQWKGFTSTTHSLILMGILIPTIFRG